MSRGLKRLSRLNLSKGIPALLQQNIPFQEKLEALEKYMEGCAPIEIEHPNVLRSGPLFYKDMVMPKGTVLIGRVHKYPHMTLLIDGAVVVWSSDTGLRYFDRYSANLCEPGTQRLFYAIEDTVWANIHHLDIDVHEAHATEFLTSCNSQAYLEFRERYVLGLPQTS